MQCSLLFIHSQQMTCSDEPVSGVGAVYFVPFAKGHFSGVLRNYDSVHERFRGNDLIRFNSYLKQFLYWISISLSKCPH